MDLIHWSFLEQYLMLFVLIQLRGNKLSLRVLLFVFRCACHLDFAVVKHCDPQCIFPYFPALTDYTLTVVWKCNYCDLLLVVIPSMRPCGTRQLSAPAASDTHQTFVHLPRAHCGYHFPIRDCWGLLAESSWWAHCEPKAITTDSRIADVTYTHIHTQSLPHSLSAHARLRWSTHLSCPSKAGNHATCDHKRLRNDDKGSFPTKL